MNRAAKKLLILGGTLTVAGPLLLFGGSFAYGLWQAFALNSAVGGHHPVDLRQMVGHEMDWLIPLSAVSFVMGLTGFVMLTVGVIRYFVSPAPPEPGLG